MRLEVLWVVRDPGPTSGPRDILFRCLAERLPYLLAGTGPATWVAEHTALYTDELSARQDANARLAARLERDREVRP